jgi:endoglucanase
MAAARFKMPTDWISLADETAAAARGFPSVFGYDAVRIPLYLAWGRPNDRSALEVFAPLLTSARIRSPSVIDLRTGRAQEPLALPRTQKPHLAIARWNQRTEIGESQT